MIWKYKAKLFLYLRSCVIFLTNGYFQLMNCDIINNFLIFAIILQKETSAMLHKGYRDIINNFLIFAIILQKETSAMLHKGYRMLFNCLMFYL